MIKKFNNHSNDNISFWISEYDRYVTLYLFRQNYNETMYLLGKFNFLGNVQIFFVGV